jgi:ribosomal protein S27AE
VRKPEGVVRLERAERERGGDGPLRWFCGHCGESQDSPAASRVCPRCGLGLLLRADAGLAPKAGEAFLVLDQSLSVCAVSEGAERLLAISEPDAVNRHVTELLEPAACERHARVSLAAAVFRAACGEGEPLAVTVRPARTFGVRLHARIGPCGPHAAALLVFD